MNAGGETLARVAEAYIEAIDALERLDELLDEWRAGRVSEGAVAMEAGHLVGVATRAVFRGGLV